MFELYACHLSQEAEHEKGILEQSMITLVSLTDSTLQDQETTLLDEERSVEDKDPDETMEEGQRDQETKVTVHLHKCEVSFYQFTDLWTQPSPLGGGNRGEREGNTSW